MHIDESLKALFASTALLLTTGTLLHDTKLDKAYALTVPIAATVASAPGVAAGIRIDQNSSPHTHSERSSLSRTVSEATPRVQPRDDRKHYLPKYLSRDNAKFGSSSVIWPND